MMVSGSESAIGRLTAPPNPEIPIRSQAALLGDSFTSFVPFR